MILLLRPEDQDLREGQRVGMCDGDERGTAADRGETAAGAAVQLQLRRPAAPHDLDVAPQHALRMAGAERLHGCFLGREAAGKMNCRHAPSTAVGHFVLGEDAMHEAVAVALDGLGNARNISGIDPQSNDVRLDASA